MLLVSEKGSKPLGVTMLAYRQAAKQAHRLQPYGISRLALEKLLCTLVERVLHVWEGAGLVGGYGASAGDGSMDWLEW